METKKTVTQNLHQTEQVIKEGKNAGKKSVQQWYWDGTINKYRPYGSAIIK